jgi:hypothetical protein
MTAMRFHGDGRTKIASAIAMMRLIEPIVGSGRGALP